MIFRIQVLETRAYRMIYRLEADTEPEARRAFCECGAGDPVAGGFLEITDSRIEQITPVTGPEE